MNDLSILNNNEIRITSKELCDLINEFRKLEGNDTLKSHKDLMKSIRADLETLENAGFEAGGKISPGEYIDKNNQKRPCYLLNKTGAIQILAKESVVVRVKVMEYIEQLEQQLMNQALKTPKTTPLLPQYSFNNYWIKRELESMESTEIPKYINNLINHVKGYKPNDRLTTYEITRTALENLLPTFLEAWEREMLRVSLDKLNKLIENQKMFISRSKLGQATKQNKALKETIKQYELDSYNDYYYVDKHGFTVNRAYRAIDNDIKCKPNYIKWKNEMDEELLTLPSLEDMGLNPTSPKKIDIYFYLKDETFDVSNCTKSFLDALQRRYKIDNPDFDDNLFADVRTRKYFSYSESYKNGYIIFGIKDLTDEEIEALTFKDDEK